MNEDNDMNRREFAKGLLAFAGAVALGGVGMAEEGTKKMNEKCVVVYYSWSGNTRFAAETIAKKAGVEALEEFATERISVQ